MTLEYFSCPGNSRLDDWIGSWNTKFFLCSKCILKNVFHIPCIKQVCGSYLYEIVFLGRSALPCLYLVQSELNSYVFFLWATCFGLRSVCFKDGAKGPSWWADGEYERREKLQMNLRLLVKQLEKWIYYPMI